jgi:hypothetical protein
MVNVSDTYHLACGMPTVPPAKKSMKLTVLACLAFLKNPGWKFLAQ